MPILEAGGVDVVLTGHSHIYERSMLMDGAYATTTVAENVILGSEGPGLIPGGPPLRLRFLRVVAGHGAGRLL